MEGQGGVRLAIAVETFEEATYVPYQSQPPSPRSDGQVLPL